MTALDLRPCGRSGLTPRHRRPSTSPITATGSATLGDRVGEVSAGGGGSFGTPAAVILGVRYDAGPIGHAEVDLRNTVGADSALVAAGQRKLIDWAAANRGV